MCLLKSCSSSHFRYIHQKEHGQKQFQLVKTEDDGFTFEHKPFFGETESVKVSLEKLKAWKLHKGQEAEKCEGNEMEELMVHNSAMLKDEIAKAKVQTVLLEACQAHAPAKGSLMFTHGPTAVWACKAIKKGELKLFPSGTVSKIKDGKTKGKLIATYAGQPYSISSFKAVSSFDEKKGVLDAYHWVKSTAEGDEATMVAGLQTIEKVQLPYFTNPKALKAGDQVLVEKPTDDIPAKPTKRPKITK